MCTSPPGDYRITLRGIGEESSSGEDEWSMRCRISEIVFFATPYTTSALDRRVVQELLDLHEAVYPMARHPRAEELLRERGYGEYLRDLGKDLEDAVTNRLIRIEALERPWPFPEVEKPAQKDDDHPRDDDQPSVTLRLWLLDEFLQRPPGGEAPTSSHSGGSRSFTPVGGSFPISLGPMVVPYRVNGQV